MRRCEREVTVLLERAQPGARRAVRAHQRRALRLALLIEERWGVRSPRGWRAKHVRWALEHGLAGAAPATRYDYWRTARALAAALGRWPDWEPYLRGPWTRPDGRPRAPRGAGGRPPKLAHWASLRAQGRAR